MATHNPEISDPSLLAKLRWQCRRGMLELDLLLSLFLDEIYPKLSFEERELFSIMLQYPDPVLYQWLLAPSGALLFPDAVSFPRMRESSNNQQNSHTLDSHTLDSRFRGNDNLDNGSDNLDNKLAEEKQDENMALDQALEALIQKIRTYMSVKNQKTGQEHF